MAVRAMGYYDGTDLNYYYFMASNFATSDRWFNPAMSRTHPNREYLIAATSRGYAYPIGTDEQRSKVADGEDDLSGIAGRGRHLENLREPYRLRLQRASVYSFLSAD